VKSPLLASGYVGDAHTTAMAFRDGWYYPGDTGKVDAAGYLTLTGRVDQLLNLGGNKIDPFAIEEVLDAQPGVDESAVLTMQTKSGTAVLVAVVVLSSPIDETQMKKACTERLGKGRTPARIVSMKSIPRNAGGKVMREELEATLKRQFQNSADSAPLH